MVFMHCSNVTFIIPLIWFHSEITFFILSTKYYHFPQTYSLLFLNSFWMCYQPNRFHLFTCCNCYMFFHRSQVWWLHRIWLWTNPFFLVPWLVDLPPMLMMATPTLYSIHMTHLGHLQQWTSKKHMKLDLYHLRCLQYIVSQIFIHQTRLRRECDSNI